jgi:hypothetical protein
MSSGAGLLSAGQSARSQLPRDRLGRWEQSLRDAILRTIVKKFGVRPLSWETVEAALREVNYEAKMAALPAILSRRRNRDRADAHPSPLSGS